MAGLRQTSGHSPLDKQQKQVQVYNTLRELAGEVNRLQRDGSHSSWAKAKDISKQLEDVYKDVEVEGLSHNSDNRSPISEVVGEATSFAKDIFEQRNRLRAILECHGK